MRIVLIICLTILASCNQNRFTAKVKQTSLQNAEVEHTSVLDAQISSVVTQLALKVSTVQELSLAHQWTMPVFDFKGNKTHVLHVLSSTPLGKDLEVTPKTNGTVALMGISKKVAPLSFIDKDLKIILKMSRAVKSLSVKIISWHLNNRGQFFALLSDKTFYSIDDERRLTALELIDQINQLSQAEKLAAQSDVKKYLSAIWRKGTAVKVQGFNQLDFVDQRGELHLKKFLKAYGEDLSSTPTEYDVKTFDLSTESSCFWNQCWDSRAHGELNSQYLEMSGGFVQYPTQYGLTNISNLHHCEWAPFNGQVPMYDWITDPMYPMGCAPSAMSSLLDWWWRYKGIEVRGKPFNGELARYRVENQNDLSSSRMPLSNSIWTDLLSVDESGRSTLVQLFGSCYLYEGTFTFPNQVVQNIHQFFEWAGVTSQLELRSIYNYLGGNILPFINNTNGFANVLREQIGTNNQPVVALYPFGKLQMHYSPVLEFDVGYSFGYAHVMIRPLDQPTRWVNISDPWALAAGLFTFEEKK